MKVPVISSLLLMLGIASPLLAIERPKVLDDNLPAEGAAPAVEAQQAQAELPPAKPGAWLGVFSQQADEALSAQLGIQGGIVLRFVAEGSPAAEAGLNVHDVIASIDGNAVATQDDLRASVLNHDPGDEMKVEVVSGGVKRELAVKLGERPADVPQLPNDQAMAPDLDERFPDWRRQMREFDDFEGLNEQFQDQLRMMEEQLKKMERQPGFLPGPLNFPNVDDIIENLPRGEGGINFNLKSSGSVRLLDDHGSVEMKMRDGGKEVEVRDKAGELLYEGPWDTEQDKAAVAPEVRERIERLNFSDNNGGGFKLHFQGDLEDALRGLLPNDAAPEEAAPDAAEEGAEIAPE